MEETYTVAVPIRDLSVVYENIRSKMGTEITAEDQANATEIYYRILYGGPAPTYGSEFDSWSDGCRFPTHRSSARMASALPSERAGGAW